MRCVAESSRRRSVAGGQLRVGSETLHGLAGSYVYPSKYDDSECAAQSGLFVAVRTGFASSVPTGIGMFDGGYFPYVSGVDLNYSSSIGWSMTQSGSPLKPLGFYDRVTIHVTWPYPGNATVPAFLSQLLEGLRGWKGTVFKGFSTGSVQGQFLFGPLGAEFQYRYREPFGSLVNPDAALFDGSESFTVPECRACRRGGRFNVLSTVTDGKRLVPGSVYSFPGAVLAKVTRHDSFDPVPKTSTVVSYLRTEGRDEFYYSVESDASVESAQFALNIAQEPYANG